MMALMLCFLLTFTAAPGPDPTLPPAEEVGDILSYVDVSAWDEFFDQMEETEPWLRPSLLLGRLGTGEAEEGNALLLWLQGKALGGAVGALTLFWVALGTGVLSTLCSVLLGEGAVPANRVMAAGLGALLLMRLLPGVRRGLRCLAGLAELSEVSAPLVTAALLLLGSPRSAALMATLGEGLLHTFLTWMQGILCPLVLSAGVLRAVDIGGESVLSGLSKCLFSGARWGVRALGLGYMAVTALLIPGGAAADSLLLRTGRVAAGSLPLVGSMVSDSLGTAAACLSVVKGALGRTGVLLTVAQAAGPAVELLLSGFSLRAAGAMLQPLEQREMGSLLSALGETATLLGALVCAAGAMLSVSLGGVTGSFGGGV